MLKFSPLSPDLQPVGGKVALVPSISAVNAWNRCTPQSPGDEVRPPCGVCHRRFLLAADAFRVTEKNSTYCSQCKALIASPVLNCSPRVLVLRSVGLPVPKPRDIAFAGDSTVNDGARAGGGRSEAHHRSRPPPCDWGPVGGGAEGGHVEAGHFQPSRMDRETHNLRVPVKAWLHQ